MPEESADQAILGYQRKAKQAIDSAEFFLTLNETSGSIDRASTGIFHTARMALLDAGCSLQCLQSNSGVLTEFKNLSYKDPALFQIVEKAQALNKKANFEAVEADEHEAKELLKDAKTFHSEVLNLIS